MAGRQTSPSIPVPTNDRLLNLAEAAMRLRMGRSTLRQALYDGRGPVAIKLPGSDRWRFRPYDLDAYVKGGEISLVTEAEVEAKTGGEHDPPKRRKTPTDAGPDGLPNASRAKALDDQSGASVTSAPGSVPQTVEKANKVRLGKPVTAQRRHHVEAKVRLGKLAGAPSDQS